MDILKSLINMKYLFILAILFLNSSCTKDIVTNSEGTIVSLKSFWSTSNSDDGRISESGIIREGIYYNGSIIIGGRLKNERCLIMINTTDGSAVWKWQNYPTKTGNRDIYFPLLVNSDLIYSTSLYNFKIGLNDGVSKWANTFKYGFYNFNIFFNNEIYTGNASFGNENGQAIGAYKISINSGKSEFLVPVKVDTLGKLNNTSYSGGVPFAYPFLNNQDTMLSLIEDDPPGAGFKFNLTTYLYNVSKKTWVYERMPLFDASISGVEGKPLVSGNFMYVCSGGKTVCFNMLTSEKRWVNYFSDGGVPSSFLTSTPLLADGKLFIQNENTYLYCLDPVSGTQIWRQGNFGTCSHMEYLNGVVYFVSGGEGKLYAIDAANGNKLWAIPSPDLKFNSSASFDGYVGLVPPQNGQKGKIVVTTGLNAYCYEAYK